MCHAIILSEVSYAFKHSLLKLINNKLFFFQTYKLTHKIILDLITQKKKSKLNNKTLNKNDIFQTFIN